MTTVFISHSSEDRAVADEVCRYLEAQSIECWIAPRDERPGGEWAEGIVEAVETCKLLVVIVSPTSMTSQNVKTEIYMAVKRGRPVIPFRIADVRLWGGFEYYLGKIQWIDAFPNVEEYFEDLTQGIRDLVGRGEVSPTSMAANRDRHRRNKNLSQLRLDNDETRISLVASLMNRPDVVDKQHRYLKLKRVDILDSDSGNYRSYRWVTVRNTSSAETTCIIHQESGENRVSFTNMAVVAKQVGDDESKISVRSLTQVQPNFTQVFKIYFPQPLAPGDTITIVYRLDWPGELNAYVEGKASQSVSLTRYECGVDDLEFSLYDTNRMMEHSLSEVTQMYEEVESRVLGRSVVIADDPDLRPLHEKNLHGVSYRVEDPNAICYRMLYRTEPQGPPHLSDDLF